MSQPGETREAEPDSALERLAIAGTGTIACGLASAAAARGIEVTMWGRSDRSLARAREALGGERVETTRDLDALASTTLTVEAVAEELDAKHAVLFSLAARLTDGALLATTTSSLSISALGRSSGVPERFFGLHVFNPVNRMDLVELCFPDEASSDTRLRATAFCAALGKTAIEVPDEPGFVVNRLLFPYLFDAVRLMERSGMAPADVDSSMRLGAGHPMGPLELLDFIGLDVAAAIGGSLFADTGEDRYRAPGLIEELIGAGKLGRKSGAGFYDYA